MYVRRRPQCESSILTVSLVEEKFAKQNEYSETDDDSSSEDEDDIGVLATETLDSEIFATLNAIKNKDPRVYDGKSSFYTPIDPDAPVEDSDDEEKAVKPMFLRDYHRENLLAGNTGEDLEEDAPATFVQQQAHLKRSVVQEMHTAADAEGEDDDGFLVRKSTEKKSSKRSDLPDPALADKDPEEFLNKFLASRAWTKSSGGAAYVPIESDDSEDEDIAEQYEAIYNRRFEDPDAAARAKLVSYGRDAISENTVRRDEKSRRKKAREEKRRKKEEAKAQLEMEKGRLKKLKTEELMEKFKLIKEAAELEGDEETEAEVLHKLLEGDFSDKEWDAWMQERFGDKYYEDDGRPKKPTFDDDININDIVPDFVDDVEGEDEETDSEVEDEEMADAGANDDEEPKKKSKKEIVREKQEKKSKDKSTRRKFERFVEDNFDFDAEVCFRFKILDFHVLIASLAWIQSSRFPLPRNHTRGLWPWNTGYFGRRRRRPQCLRWS